MSRTLDDIQGKTPKPRAQARRDGEPVQPSTGLTPPEGDVATQSQQTQPAGQQVQGAVQGAPAGQPQEPPKPTQRDYMTFTEDQLKDGGKSEGVKMEEEAAKAGGATGTTPGAASSIPIMTEGYEQYLRDYERMQEQKRDRLAEDKERLKRQQLFATIGDGLSAFHEAYNNTRGIKPITSGKSMTGKWQERYDKLMSDIDKSDLAAAKNRLETMKARQAAYIAAAKNDYNQKVADARAQYYEETGNANRERGNAYVEGINNQNKNRDKDTDSKISHRSNQDENNNRRTDAYVGKNNAQADKARNSGSGGRGGSGGGSKGSGSLSNNPEWEKVVVKDKGTTTTRWEKIDDGGNSAGTGGGSTRGKGKGKGYGSKGKGKGKGY